MPNLDDLLVDLELRCEAGSPVEVDKLSPDSPELAAELEQRFERLQQFDRWLFEGLDDPLADTELEATLPPIAGYTIERILGVGGMGCVYLARNHELNRVEALKVLRPHEALRTPEQKRRLAKRFLREAQTLANLKHKHIVSVYQGRPRADTPYFAMEYLPRGSLAQEAERRHLMDAGPRAIVAFMIKVAQAVQYAHEHRVLHRDLKPGNILLTDAGEPIVSDFGLAKLLDPNAEPDEPALDSDPDTPQSSAGTQSTAISLPGQPMGTPRYMAPEQCAGKTSDLSSQTDVWALGVILYELLTGARPFQGQDRDTLSHSICDDSPPSMRALNSRVDEPLEAIVLRCLAKSPGDRYDSAHALADDLALWRRYERPAAYRESRWRGLVRKARRHPVLISLLALALGATFSLLVIRYQTDPQRSQELIEQDLREGRPATLIRDTGPPLTFSIKAAAERSKLSQDRDKPFLVSTPGTCLVELLPAPPVDFQLQADVRHEDNPGDGRIGLYFDYRDSDLLPWPSCFVAGFADRGDTALDVKQPDGRRGSQVRLLFSYLQPQPDREPVEGTLTLVKGSFFESHAFQPRPGLWRTLGIRVIGGEIKGFWLKEGAMEPAFSVDKQLIDKRAHLFALANNDNRLRELWRPSQRSAIGLYVSRSTASFRNVIVEAVR